MVEISNSTSLYFYSALFQSNAALIALIAMTLVYRKQYLDLMLDKREDRMINFLCQSAKIFVDYEDIFEFEKYDEEMRENITEENNIKLKNLLSGEKWIASFKELKKVKNKRDDLWNDAMLSLKSVFVILGASAIALPLSDQIHGYMILEVFLFVIFCIGEIVSLGLLLRFIKSQFVI